jgi:hypothetical protein
MGTIEFHRLTGGLNTLANSLLTEDVNSGLKNYV